MKKYTLIALGVLSTVLLLQSCEDTQDELQEETEQTFYFATEQSLGGSTWTAYFPQDWTQPGDELFYEPTAEQWSFHFVSLNQVEESLKTGDGTIIEGWVEEVMWVGNKMYIDQSTESHNFITLNGYEFTYEQHNDDGSLSYVTFHPY